MQFSSAWRYACQRFDKRDFLRILLTTALLGFLSYGYTILTFMPSHDSLNEFAMDAYGQVKLGRFLVPIYQIVFGMTLTTPWTGALMGFLWTALAVYAVTLMFDLRAAWPVFLTCAIFTLNTTVTALAVTYTPWIGPDLMAVFLAAAAALCWKAACDTRSLVFPLLGACLLTATLMLYQAQLSVMLVLVMLACIMQLLAGEDAKAVFLRGLLAIGMIAAGAALYALSIRLLPVLTGVSVSSGSYNSIANLWENSEPLLSRFAACYREVADAFFKTPGYVFPPTVMRIVHALLALALLAGVLALLFAVRRGALSTLLLVLLVALLPLGMNFSRILNPSVHELMRYGFWLMYFMVVLLANRCMACGVRARRVLQIVCSALLGVMLFAQVQTANLAGIKKSTEQQATFSVMTRVLDRIEQTPGYLPGETPVTFIGMPRHILRDAAFTTDIAQLAGLTNISPLSNYPCYDDYFDLILKSPINLAEEGVAWTMLGHAQVADMPVFPRAGSVQLIDGVIVVKFHSGMY